MHRMRIATIVMTSLLLAAPGRDRPDTLVHAADPAIEQPQAAATTGTGSVATGHHPRIR